MSWYSSCECGEIECSYCGTYIEELRAKEKKGKFIVKKTFKNLEEDYRECFEDWVDPLNE